MVNGQRVDVTRDEVVSVGMSQVGPVCPTLDQCDAVLHSSSTVYARTRRYEQSGSLLAWSAALIYRHGWAGLSQRSKHLECVYWHSMVVVLS